VKFVLLIFFSFAGLGILLVKFCKLLGLFNLVLEVFFEGFFVTQLLFVVGKPNHSRNLIFFTHQ